MVTSLTADGVVVEKEHMRRLFLACHFLSFPAQHGSQVLERSGNAEGQSRCPLCHCVRKGFPSSLFPSLEAGCTLGTVVCPSLSV